MTPDLYFALHGHFYQPPREDPFTGEIPLEDGAAPFANWNERITAECYGPNAEAGNFDRLSFNLGGTLAAWLAAQQPAVYARIVEADRLAQARAGAGNALAQPVHHTILPLARRRDQQLQIRWGVDSFEHRFGRRPLGAWLPECAVDQETLELLAESGLRFTIVSDEQVAGELPVRGHAGPYRVALGRGRSFAVYVRERHLSNQIAFDLDLIAAHGDPADWLRAELAQRAGGRSARLVLVALDGETFGHHHRHGVAFLQRLLAVEGAGLPFRLTGLDAHLREHPARYAIRLREPSSWSCAHGVARWVVGCDCTPGDSRWKPALRRALDNLAAELDGLYGAEARAAGADPWRLLEGYSAVFLRRMDGPRYLVTRGLGGLTGAQGERLLALLRAEFHRQRMFTSCAFFFDELTRLEPRLAVANAARAIALAYAATGDDLGPGFRADLRHALDYRAGVTGADIYDVVRREGLGRRPLARAR